MGSVGGGSSSTEVRPWKAFEPSVLSIIPKANKAYGMSQHELEDFWGPTNRIIDAWLGGNSMDKASQRQLRDINYEMSNKVDAAAGGMERATQYFPQALGWLQEAVPYISEGADIIRQGLPYFGEGADWLRKGGNWLNQGGQTIQGGLGLLEPIARGSMMPGIGDTGEWGSQSNPYLADLYQQTMNDITNQLSSQAAAAMRTGSGYATQNLAKGLAEGLTPLRLQDYYTEASRRDAAIRDLMTGGQALGGVGQGMTGVGQAFGGLGQGLGTMGQAMTGVGGLYGNLAATMGNLGIGMGNLYQGIGNMEIQKAAAESPLFERPDILAQQGINAYQSMVPLPFIPVSGYTQNIMQPAGTFTDTNTDWSSWSAGFSDRRLKEDIEEVGALHDGQKVYRYRFKGGKAFLIGLMADEVEQMVPEAVGETFGFKTVDMQKATETAAQIGKEGK